MCTIYLFISAGHIKGQSKCLSYHFAVSCTCKDEISARAILAVLEA